jgi:hypothetical protein
MIGMRDHFASADVADSSAVSRIRLEICFIIVKRGTGNDLVGDRQIQVFLVFYPRNKDSYTTYGPRCKHFFCVVTEENGVDLLQVPYILYKCIVHIVPHMSPLRPTAVSSAGLARPTCTGPLAVNGLGYRESPMRRSALGLKIIAKWKCS